MVTAEAAPLPATHRSGATRRAAVLELALVAAAPLLLFFVLRLALMPWPDLNDPAMHTAFLVHPQDVFTRYAQSFMSTARLREGARVGFLEPGRITYLAFGGVPGFVVFRYLLALVAVAPTYLLLKRVHGRAAGALAVVLILSSPVVITAWGTDFPDSAAVSYLMGGVSCLAMPSTRRAGWILAAAVLFTLAGWAFAAAAPLAAVALVVYLLVRWPQRGVPRLREAGLLVGGAMATTLVLLALSGPLFGRFDFIAITIDSIRYLAQPSQEAIWHSASWRWAPYDTYLLVLPVIVAVWGIALRGPLRRMEWPQLVVGATAAASVLAAALLQFAGKLQILEVHYFSSLLWAPLLPALAMALAALARPGPGGKAAWWLPAVALVVPLLFEIHPQLPAFGWLPAGAAIGTAVLVCAAAARFLLARGSQLGQGGGMAATGLVIAGILVLTCAPIPPHPYPPGTTGGLDPPPRYASALGGGNPAAVDLYRITTELPGFVGDATYTGEQLLMWWPGDELHTLIEPIGMYHAYFDSLPGFGTLDASGRARLALRRPAQILLLSLTGAGFDRCLASLGPYRPVLQRTGVLRSGPIALHVWLIRLGTFARAAAA